MEPTDKKDIGKLVSFHQMLNDKEEIIHKILIPKIQRDYVQGRKGEESIRNRFLDSLFEAIDDDKSKELILDFVFGQKEEKNNIVFYPVDGQQRITTLFLLNLYIGKRAGRNVEFLRKFSYETRESSKQFCKLIIDIPAQNFINIRQFIEDQWWFTGLWRKDPTILAMINMLDAIDVHYKEKSYTSEDLEKVFSRLNSKVKFWRLHLSDLNTTDDLYIKMNSRGKELTDFEHIKAMLDEFTGMNGEISAKVDTDWTNLLWRYHVSTFDLELENDKYTDNGLDNCFHNLLIFYLNIEGCKRGYIDFQYPETDLVKLVTKVLGFQKPKEEISEEEFIRLKAQKKKEAKQIMERFEKIMDFFSAQDSQQNYIHDPNSFFGEFIQCDYDKWEENVNENSFLNFSQKVFIGKRNHSDLLLDVCKTGILKNLPTIYTEAFFEHAYNPGNKSVFQDRLRILRNIVENTEIHARDFRNTLLVVDELIRTGNMSKNDINDELNKTQKEQENFKLKWLSLHPTHTNLLKALENHWLLLGNLNMLIETDAQNQSVDINIMALERFGRLFNSNCDYMLTERVLLTSGDYAPAPKIKGVKSYGGADWGRWKDFTQSFNRDTPGVIQRFLNAHNNFTNDALNQIITSANSSLKCFSWRYYLRTYQPIYNAPKAKYRYLEGKYSYQKLNANGGGGKEYFWNPYNLSLEAMMKEEGIDCHTDESGGPITFKDSGIKANINENSIEFIYPDESRFNHIIPQNQDGCDILDRIIYAKGACLRILADSFWIRED